MSREEQYEAVSSATSKALKRCWKDPAWRARVLAKRAATRRSLTKKQIRAFVERTRASRLRNVAAAYGLSLDQWLAMTPKEKYRHKYTHGKLKPIQLDRENIKQAAQHHGIPLDRWKLMNQKEKQALRIIESQKRRAAKLGIPWSKYSTMNNSDRLKAGLEYNKKNKDGKYGTN